MKDKIDQLIHEYEQLTAQIIHWDSLSLRKDQFYFAVEGVFLISVAKLLYNEITKSGTTSPLIIVLIVLAAIFNIAMCWIWFRTNRRNREWLDVRLDRAREIEKEDGIELHILTRQEEEFSKPEYKGHGASKSVLHIPTIFCIVWGGVIVFAVLLCWY